MKRLCIFVTAAAATTAWCAPAVAETARQARDPERWLAVDGTDAVVATLAQAALGVVAGWVTLALVAALAAALPGSAGALARRIAGRLLPAAIYRLAAGAAGLGVVLAPVAAGATTAPPIPAPTLPTTAIDAPALPATAADPPSTPVPPTTPPVPDDAGAVTVAPGDSLWSIAAAHLPGPPDEALIAASWPRWYDANRAVIGGDPSLILPGQVLRAPGATR